MLSSVNLGRPRSSTAAAITAAASADGPNSASSRTRCAETAMLGIDNSAPSSAPDTVPEYVTSSPRFHPLLMPETIRSGLSFKTCVIAMFTQSVGVPSTAKMFGPTRSMRSGRRSVSAWPMALASWIGATMVTSPRRRSASASALIPSECTPSSLVTSMRGIGTYDCTIRVGACPPTSPVNRSNTAAIPASAAPAPNAVAGLKRSYSTPNATLAVSAPTPSTAL